MVTNALQTMLLKMVLSLGVVRFEKGELECCAFNLVENSPTDSEVKAETFQLQAKLDDGRKNTFTGLARIKQTQTQTLNVYL